MLSLLHRRDSEIDVVSNVLSRLHRESSEGHLVCSSECDRKEIRSGRLVFQPACRNLCPRKVIARRMHVSYYGYFARSNITCLYSVYLALV